MPYLPTELLLFILNHVRDVPRKISNRVPLNLDLLSCSIVCRHWYQCAFPLLVNDAKASPGFDLDNYTAVDIERTINIMAESQRYRLLHATLIKHLDIDLVNLAFHVEATGRLLCALRPHLKAIRIYFQRMQWVNDITDLHETISQLLPSLSDITTLDVKDLLTSHAKVEPPQPEPKGLRRVLKAVGFSYPQYSSTIPSCLAIPDTQQLRSNLHTIHFTSSFFTATALQILATCPNIHTARFRDVNFHILPQELAATVASWPRLRCLSIRYQKIYSIALGPIVVQLAHSLPHLEVLELDNSCARENNVYHNFLPLLQHCAPTLVSLALPRYFYNVSSPIIASSTDEFLDFLFNLSLPNLRNLDLSCVGDMPLNPGSFFERNDWQVVKVSWPELRRLDVKHYDWLSPNFLRVVIGSCPKLEVVRLYLGYGYAYSKGSSVLLDAGFVNVGSHEIWASMSDLWVRPGAVPEVEDVMAWR